MNDEELRKIILETHRMVAEIKNNIGLFTTRSNAPPGPVPPGVPPAPGSKAPAPPKS